MIVGVLTVELLLEECRSLKDKRRIVRSVYDKIRHKFNVSVAEVGHHDVWRRSQLAVACVSTDTRQANRVLSTVVQFIERQGAVEIADYTVEFV